MTAAVKKVVYRAFLVLSALTWASATVMADTPAQDDNTAEPTYTTQQEQNQNLDLDNAPQALLAHLADIAVLEGTFQQTRHIAVLAIPLHSHGRFLYQREQGIVWRTEEPIANEIHITHEEGIVAIDERGGTRSFPASEVVATIFLSLFAGELDRLRGYFSVDAVTAEADRIAQAEQEESAHRHWALRLTPAVPTLASQIDHILVAGSDHVDTVIIQDANGDRSELSLTLAQPSENAQP